MGGKKTRGETIQKEKKERNKLVNKKKEIQRIKEKGNEIKK